MTVKTKLFAILGYPVKHSFSPKMYDYWFKEAGLNCSYFTFKVNKRDLRQVLLYLRFLGFSGLNITLPYKIEAIKYLDAVDNIAKEIGSINTVCIKRNKLYGYNTDWQGFIKDLNDKNIDLKNKNILVFGAGGAAKAILYALKVLKVNQVYISNRTIENAVNLEKEYIKSVNFNEIKNIFPIVDIFINCSSCGMHKKDVLPFRIDKFKKNLIIYDLIYNKLTPFVKFAKANNIKVFTGEGMLVCQGAYNFRMWTGIYPNIKNMEKILKNYIK